MSSPHISKPLLELLARVLPRPHPRISTHTLPHASLSRRRIRHRRGPLLPLPLAPPGLLARPLHSLEHATQTHCTRLRLARTRRHRRRLCIGTLARRRRRLAHTAEHDRRLRLPLCPLISFTARPRPNSKLNGFLAEFRPKPVTRFVPTASTSTRTGGAPTFELLLANGAPTCAAAGL